MSIIFDQARWDELKERVRQGLHVKTHSALVEQGDVFIALPGTRHDGTMYIDQALERGASYIVACNVNRWAHDVSAEFLVHPSPRQALGELAAARFGTGNMHMKIVGITGTNGKTTTSYLIEHLLTSAGKKVGVIGTVNVRWPGHCHDVGMTTPDCWTLHDFLARMREDGVDVVCMEVSSHALDQERVAGITFDVAVFTNLTQDHLDYHHDMESYFLAKARLFQGSQGDEPLGIINVNDPYGKRLQKARSHCMGYGLETGALGNGLGGRLKACTRKGLELVMEYNGEQWFLSSPLVGRHNAMNLLAAQAVGLSLGLPVSAMQDLQSFAGVPGRLQRVVNARGLDIFVDYAHTPDALEKVCQALKGLGFKRLHVVFGCGGDRDHSKRPRMGAAVAATADVAIVTSDNPRHEAPEAIIDQILPGMNGTVATILREVDRRAAISRAIDGMEPGDVLLVAGKGHETYQQIGDTKYPFDDVQVIMELLHAEE
ncbi:UDP-N-acetylmuramoyl-L-alanyl-D-glutamate--2,6-diaminopimelate ligase [Desulfoplanes formicivorans]|uniref:UDP-N-acetylmuramoyl-L-alanyl-D-glutamate--2,6-diaminopimelate ligase n=1 Tax=Desulfoplanes formicivorans TaxID=1592317 RepID=A0A194ACF6_9BACT|nr:UDP-N-acetylmuramoyl-L-alanyl-D-glutamate--2,6-diaminopimelate ligase [Desulfoplanes formicivorans]GAU07817.1 UDP-N-acetylmuramoyl-L-alanyl-D-glutamate--2,6-diaminopimelate ligase [Desulfoplanes formicivorans]